MFTFGGGYAMIALIENTCVEQKKWLTHDEMMDIAVIAESTPGPIAINTATHVGYKRAGVIGALAATVGMVLPSFIIIFVISMFLEQFMEFTLIANAFQGIKIGVGLLIFDAGLKMFKKMPAKRLSRGLMLFGLVAMLCICIGRIAGNHARRLGYQRWIWNYKIRYPDYSDCFLNNELDLVFDFDLSILRCYWLRDRKRVRYIGVYHGCVDSTSQPVFHRGRHENKKENTIGE